MSLMDYPNVTPPAFEGHRNSRGIIWLRAAAIIACGSVALWGLIVYAVWQLI
jgi:hypothetical protein